MKRKTLTWVRKAEDDWDAACELAARSPPLRDAVCFHCQQAAEKAIKALDEALKQRDAAFSAAFPNAIARFPQLAALGMAIEERAAILHAADEAVATLIAVDTDQSGLASIPPAGAALMTGDR